MTAADAIAPYYADVVRGPAASATWLRTSDGVRIRLGIWPHPDAARGTVVIFPGRTEYIEKYAEVAGDLQAAGYSVAAIDWRGQGIADRLLKDRQIGHVAQFTDYQHDVQAVMAALRARNMPKPWHLLAHSMGGAIGLRSLIDGQPFARAVFSAPMWGIQMSDALRPVAWALSAVMPKVGLGNIFAPSTDKTPLVVSQPFADNPLTTDAAQYAAMTHQVETHPDLGLSGPSVQWLGTALREMKLLSTRPSPSVPCTTLLGTNERIVDPEAIRTRMDRWRGGSLVMIEPGEHEVLMEAPTPRTA
ncbi:MAG: alpha/beta hydrolase, partial [Pseudomonadota bacterium]